MQRHSVYPRTRMTSQANKWKSISDSTKLSVRPATACESAVSSRCRSMLRPVGHDVNTVHSEAVRTCQNPPHLAVDQNQLIGAVQNSHNTNDAVYRTVPVLVVLTTFNAFRLTLSIIIIITDIYIAQVRKGHKCAMLAEMAVWFRNCLCLYSYLHN